MLGKRYQNDGKPAVFLQAPQREMKSRIDEKVQKGMYTLEKVVCCVCNTNDDFELLSEKDRYGLYFSVVICKKCGLVQTNPRMTRRSYDLFYASEYIKLDRLYSNRGERRTLDEIFLGQYGRGERIWTYLENAGILKKPAAELFVFEVGCAAGGILKFFQDKGSRVKGIDLGKEEITYGKETYGLDLSEGTIFDVKLDKQPDLVIYSHSFEHLLRPNEELTELKQIISKDGILYVLAPDIKALLDDGDPLNFFRIAHTYHYSMHTLTNVLHKNGWEFVTGHEGLMVIGKPAGANASLKTINDYEETMGFLYQAEKRRFIHKALWYLEIAFSLCIRKFLKFLGLYTFAKNLRRKLQNQSYEN